MKQKFFYNILWVFMAVFVLVSCETDLPQPTQPGVTQATEDTISSSNCSHEGERIVSPLDGTVMMCVPAGKFLMGSDLQESSAVQEDEVPVHEVEVDAFWMDRTEVTNGQFLHCVQAGICRERKVSPFQWGVSSDTREDYFSNPAYADYPVIMLSWEEAQTYCNWVGRRLPTEAEWEKAARGASLPEGQEQRRIYPWGNELTCKMAAYFDCVPDTQPVVSYLDSSSPYGVLNLSGNVWEWTADWYEPDYYEHSAAVNPSGPVSGDFHTLRGGAWNSLSADVRVTNRINGKPEHYTDGAVGFRCAADVPDSP